MARASHSDRSMYRRSLAALLLSLAAAHSVGGSVLADSETATLLVAGATAGTRWVATQILGASIAAYAVAALATLQVAAPESWRRPAAIVGAACSLLLASLLWGTAHWAPFLALAGVVAVVATARGRLESRAGHGAST